MVVPGAMATRTADELATMDADELRKIVQSLQSQSQQSTSGLGPSTGGGMSAGSGQTLMMVQGKHSNPPSLNEATSYDVWLKRFNLWKRNCGYDKERIADLLIESLGNNSKLKKGLADKFFEKYSEEQMSGPGALDVVVYFPLGDGRC